jgi:hypothetical protein
VNTADTPAVFRITPRLIIGLGILSLGLLWTLDNLDLLESEPITDWWPVILIAIGVLQLFDPRSAKVGPAILTIIGTGLLLDNLDLIDFDLGDLIPLAIAAFGAKLIWEAVGRKNARLPGTDDDSTIHAFAMMAGTRRQSTSTDFRGGDVSAVMGGVELDLRSAQIRDGQEILIDAFAFWGGVEISVPAHWRVVGRVTPVMGGFIDKTSATAEGGPTVVIRGTAIMGAIEVKN